MGEELYLRPLRRPPFHTQIRAKSKQDIAHQIGAFAFESFVMKGIGAVLAHLDRWTELDDGTITAELIYASHRYEYKMLPFAAIELVESYDAVTQVVLVRLSKDGSAACSIFESRDCLSPLAAYSQTREGQVNLSPGDVIRTGQRIGELEPGIFVFRRQDQTMMRMARTTMDEAQGEIVETDQEVLVHMDYRESFTFVGVEVRDDAEDDWGVNPN